MKLQCLYCVPSMSGTARVPTGWTASVNGVSAVSTVALRTLCSVAVYDVHTSVRRPHATSRQRHLFGYTHFHCFCSLGYKCCSISWCFVVTLTLIASVGAGAAWRSQAKECEQEAWTSFWASNHNCPLTASHCSDCRSSSSCCGGCLCGLLFGAGSESSFQRQRSHPQSHA